MVVLDEVAFRRLPGMIALLRSARALARGDMPEAVKNARRALDLAPEDAHLMLGGAASVLGLAAWANGDLEAAHRLTAEGMANVQQAGYISLRYRRLPLPWRISRLRKAGSTRQCPPMSGDCSGRRSAHARWPARDAADMHVGMSALHHEHNDLTGRRAAPAHKPGTGRACQAAAKPVSLARRQWRAYGRPRAIRTARSTCSTRPGGCTMATFSRMCARSRRGRHGCGLPRAGWMKPRAGRVSRGFPPATN